MKFLPINFITVQKDHASPNELAKLIGEKKKPGHINVRTCQKNDTIGSIALGLIDNSNESIWKSKITVMYVGTSEFIKKEQTNNPTGELSTANLCFPDQYIFFNSNQKILIVCDDKELIESLYPGVL